MRIIELPVCQWTHQYKKILDSVTRVASKNDKDKEKATNHRFIEQVDHYSDDKMISIDVHLTQENMILVIQEGLKEKFKLTTTIKHEQHAFV